MKSSVHDLFARPLNRVSGSAAHLLEVGRRKLAVTPDRIAIGNPEEARQCHVQERLAQVQRHLERAERRIEEQIILIERLEAAGHATGEAERLLSVLIDVIGKLTLRRDFLERRAATASHRALVDEVFGVDYRPAVVPEPIRPD